MSKWIDERLAWRERWAFADELSINNETYFSMLEALKKSEEALRTCRRHGSGYWMAYDELGVEEALKAIEDLGKE